MKRTINAIRTTMQRKQGETWRRYNARIDGYIYTTVAGLIIIGVMLAHSVSYRPHAPSIVKCHDDAAPVSR